MYVSIDIGTLGLNPDTCDVIEFGAVIDDLKSPLDALPKFHCYLFKDNYRGEPYAMSMNVDSLKKIANQDSSSNYLKPNMLDSVFSTWLINKGFPFETEFCNKNYEYIKVVKPTVAGKNFVSFDLQFLTRLPNWGETVQVRHRFLDPAILYFDPLTMEDPPDLETCLSLAGIKKELKHNALDDAIDVVRCLRHKWFN